MDKGRWSRMHPSGPGPRSDGHQGEIGIFFQQHSESTLISHWSGARKLDLKPHALTNRELEDQQNTAPPSQPRICEHSCKQVGSQGEIGKYLPRRGREWHPWGSHVPREASMGWGWPPTHNLLGPLGTPRGPQDAPWGPRGAPWDPVGPQGALAPPGKDQSHFVCLGPAQSMGPVGPRGTRILRDRWSSRISKTC